jgi:ribosomal protein S18 acetylase RimI-like enzyme
VRAGGHRAITVETQDINAAACAFYERMGCTVVSIDPDAYPDLPGETQVMYRKVLLAE